MTESSSQNQSPDKKIFLNVKSQPSHFATLEKRLMLSSFKESFHQYLIHSSLHGLKYVGDRTITRIERYLEVFAIYFDVQLIARVLF